MLTPAPRPGTTVFERHAPDPRLVGTTLAGSRLAPAWLDDVADAPHHEPLRGTTRADLVVVGGGYAGLWTAVRARRRDPGRRVVLLEGGTVGWAASGRNGGFCAASLTHGAENGRTRWPEEYDTLERLGLANLDDMGEELAELGVDAQWERTGELDVATEAHQVGWLREAAAADPGARFLDRDATRALVRSPTYEAGLLDERGCALVHPARLAVGLARAAADLGVEVHERSVVRSLETPGRHPGGGVVARTDTGAVHAAQAVLATNAFPSLLRRNRLMTVPVYDYVLMTEPLDAARRASLGWAGRQGVGDSANQFHYYRLSADDRLLFGGYDAVYRYGGRVRAAHEDRDASYRRLASHLLTTFPQLEGVRVTHRWAGAIDTCTRFCAFTGTARQGRVGYAAGFTGLGVGATRFTADVVLDQLAGLDTERTRLRLVRERPLPFPPEPLASLGIHLTRWSLDRADHREGRRNLWLRGLDAAGLGFDS
ncbi:NAD(P)/FAD-dependent oxidoreductase [Aquipuribacter nitratireducens]|uniref:NAD(P)/FAD-dependent oxidoreductase n=1 Tax=Aquipuribacter nitratireducens TaxID=650104 RepID=A0ABW0GMA6_9MICO